jgi:hypothetical protein
MAEHQRPRQPRLDSLRMRTTVASVLVVGVATALGAGVLLLLFRESLLGQLEVVARVRASEIGASVGADACATSATPRTSWSTSWTGTGGSASPARTPLSWPTWRRTTPSRYGRQ